MEGHLYIKKNIFDKSIYEKTEENGKITKEKYCYYDDKQRLIKTVVLHPEVDVYTNEFVETEEFNMTQILHIYRKNGMALDKSVTRIDKNGIDRYEDRFEYNIKSKEWEFKRVKECNDLGLVTYEKTDYGTDIQYEYNPEGFLIMEHDVSKNIIKKYLYDYKNRVVKVIHNNGYEEVTNFNDDGKVIYRKTNIPTGKVHEFKIENCIIDEKKYKRETTNYYDGDTTIIETELGDE